MTPTLLMSALRPWPKTGRRRLDRGAVVGATSGGGSQRCRVPGGGNLVEVNHSNNRWFDNHWSGFFSPITEKLGGSEAGTRTEARQRAVPAPGAAGEADASAVQDQAQTEITTLG